MEWGKLSIESRNILEWLSDLTDEEYPILNIKKNKIWSMKSTKFKSSEILVTDLIFNEVRNYAYEDKDIYLLKNNDDELKFVSRNYLQDPILIKQTNYLEGIENFINHNLGLDFISKDMTIAELLQFIDRVKTNYIPVIEQLGRGYKQ